MKSSVIKHTFPNRHSWIYKRFDVEAWNAWYKKTYLNKDVDNGLVFFGFIFNCYWSLRRKLGLFR